MNVVLVFMAIHIQPFLLPHYCGSCYLQIVASAAPSQFLYSCYSHIHPRYTRLTGAINIMQVHQITFKLSAWLCDMLHSYYIIIIHLCQMAVNYDRGNICTHKTQITLWIVCRTKFEMSPFHCTSSYCVNSTWLTAVPFVACYPLLSATEN